MVTKQKRIITGDTPLRKAKKGNSAFIYNPSKAFEVDFDSEKNTYTTPDGIVFDNKEIEEKTMELIFATEKGLEVNQVKDNTLGFHSVLPAKASE